MKSAVTSLLLCSSFLLPACVDDPADQAADDSDAAPAPSPATAIDLPASGTAHVHTPNGVLPVSYERVGDRVVFQEDMMTSVASFQNAMLDAAEVEAVLAGNADTLQRAAVRAIGRYRWPGGYVRYRFHENLTQAQRDAFIQARDHWAANTNYTFIEITAQTGDFVEIRPGDGNGVCRADVGRQGGEQELEADNCGWQALVHELGHTLGFYHEHTRFDRDSFVTIHWDAIQSSRRNDFERYIDHPQGRDGTDAGPYDYGSIMHYGNFSGAIDPAGTPNRRPTITTWPAGIPIGQRSGLSAGDIEAANRMMSPGGVVTDDRVVQLFSGQNFTGNMITLVPGRTYHATVGELGIVGDDAASSITIPPGLGVRAWSASVFGPSVWMAGNHATLPAGFDNDISHLSVSRAVTVYSAAGRSGTSQTFPIGEWKANAGDLSIVGNDAISSLYVPPGLIAELCWSETGVGSTGSYCSTYEGGGIDITSSLNNQTSLIRVKPAVTVYTNANMAYGPSKALPVGTWINTQLAPVGNDKVSSLVVGDGLKATLCDTLSGGGTCEVFRGDVVYVGAALNDRVSWIKVEANTTP